jgi:hypothetical protein
MNLLACTRIAIEPQEFRIVFSRALLQLCVGAAMF